jgi:hypothetical protein
MREVRFVAEFTPRNDVPDVTEAETGDSSLVYQIVMLNTARNR